jgi:aminoglycoside phosphotransferase (APT) family kinase protein
VALSGRTTTLGPAALEPLLSGALGHAPVRRLCADPLGHGLTEMLGVCLPDASSWRLELLQSKFKPGRKLTAYYRLSPAHPAALPPGSTEDSHRHRHLAVTWFVDRQPAPLTGQQPPGTRLTTASEDGRIVLRVCPADPAMPQLSRLTDPQHLADLVAELSGHRVAARRLAVDTVRYRPGQRHVERVRLDDEPWAYVKTDRDASGARAVAVATYLRDLLTREAPQAAVARPLGYVAEEAAALWWNVPGVPLSRRLTTGSTGAVQAVAEAGRVLRVLHESPTGPDSLLRKGGPGAAHAEATETLRAGEHVRALVPDVGATYEQCVSDVVEALDRTPGQAEVVSHGDYKSDNLIVHGDRLTILDLDRAAWADPARDLGKFLADLRWWCRDPAGAAALTASFRTGYGVGDDARWERAGLWSALFRLRMTARRLAVHDVDWTEEVRGRVDDVAEGLRATRGT